MRNKLYFFEADVKEQVIGRKTEVVQKENSVVSNNKNEDLNETDSIVLY